MKNIRYALFNLRRRRLRTVLTILAVTVGTFLVGVMMSLGVGLQGLVVDQIKDIQSLNEITVLPSEANKQLFSQADIKTIQTIPEVQGVEGFLSLASTQLYLNRAWREIKVLGVDAQTAGQLDVEAGISDFSLDINTVLINQSWAPSFGVEFAEEIIGKQVQLRTKNSQGKTTTHDLRIIGVFNKAPLLDTGIIISDKLAWQLRSNKKSQPQYDQLRVLVRSFQDVEAVAETIKSKGFRAITLDEILTQLVKYFRLFELALGVFGFITLGVAALGIINTMTMAIYERTREIGVMRAVGAARNHVLKLFVMEASLIGLIGGLLGMVLSWLFVLVLEKVLNNWMIGQEIIDGSINIFSTPWWLWLGVILFAGLVGLLAGLLPAIRASRLDPIKALRRE